MTTLSATALDSGRRHGLHRGLRAILASDERIELAILRIVLGLVILPHGLQKTLGLFGGYGFRGTYGFFTDSMGLPSFVALAVILIESIGALSLVLGFGTRLAALGLGAVMIGAVLTTHVQHGFFMNWFGAQSGEGFEYHVLVLAIVVVLLREGGGSGALDRVIVGRLAAMQALAS